MPIKHVLERILSKVRYDSGCWIFTGARDPNGYGRVNAEGTQLAHRQVYIHLIGEPKYTLDHLCRNPSCVNPWHLDDVPHAENVRRGKKPPTPSHCPKGHEYTALNTRQRPNKGLECRTCNRIDTRDRGRRNRKAGKLDEHHYHK